MGISRRLAANLMKTDFARNAITEGADLSVFRQRPSGRILAGMICIAVSYIMCWPVISALGVLAIYVRKPLLIAVGGPVVWISSHFLCMFGLYLTGADHTKALLKWLVRIFVEKHMPEIAQDRDLLGVNSKK